MKKLVFTIFLLLVSQYSVAAWSGAKELIMIYPRANSQNVLFQLDSASPTDCPGEIGRHYVLKETHKNFKNIYSLLLTAYTTREKVNIEIGTECTQEGYTKIHQVIMQR